MAKLFFRKNQSGKSSKFMGFYMNILNLLKTKHITGGLSNIDTTNNTLKISVAFQGSVKINIPWTEINTWNMIFFHNKVTDMYGNSIFWGSTGNFTFNERTFKASPIHGGTEYTLIGPLIN